MFSFVKKRQDAPVDCAAHIEVTIKVAFQRNNDPKFVVIPVLDQKLAVRISNRNLFGCEAFEVKLIGPHGAGTEITCTINHKRLSEGAVDLRLNGGECLADLAICHEWRRLAFEVEIPRQRLPIAGQFATVFILIGLRRGE